MASAQMGKLSLKPRAFHLALKPAPRLFSGRLGPHQVTHSPTGCSAAGRAKPRTDGWHTQPALPHPGLTEVSLCTCVRFQEPLTKSLDPGMCGNRCGRRGQQVLLACQASAPSLCSPYSPSVGSLFWPN